MKNVTIVMPAYNEESVIGDLVAEIKAVGDYEIIVVDDGSTDRTAEVAGENGAKVLSQPYNIGNGAAVKRGIMEAMGNIILLMDADGQHPPQEIPGLLREIEGCDMVVGVRSAAAKVSPFRTAGNRILIAAARYLSGHKIPDLTSGFRAIKKEAVLRYTDLFPKGYSYPTTITLAFLNDGLSVKYLSLDTIGRRKGGKSNLNPFREGIKFIGIIARMVILFNPLKVFLPMATILFLIAASFFVRDIVLRNYWASKGSITLLGILGALCLTFGFLTDQLSHLRRLLSIITSREIVREKKEKEEKR